MADLERLLARNVRPRKYVRDERSIIAIGREQILVERTGEILPVTKLSDLILSEASSILVVENAPAILLPLRDRFGELPNFQFKVAPVTRTTLRPKHTDKPIRTLDVTVAFVGFSAAKDKSKGGKRNGANRYHYPIDPSAFHDRGLRDLFPDSDLEDDYLALYQWGIDVRDWCQRQGLKVSARKGGLAAQLLRDPRFYSEPRRKVPKDTNARAREHLPGNHYELVAQPNAFYDAHYLDMTAAHHSAAASITFPSANELFACGRFKEPPTEPSLTPWAAADTPKFTALMRTHGLFLLVLAVPPLTEYDFPPPWARRPGLQLAYVYSNEFPMLADNGIAVRGIEACWISGTVDKGLNRYADWSLGELSQMSDQRKRWGKSVLLSTYGMLAARPVTREFGWHRAEGGEPWCYVMKAGVQLPVMRKAQKTENESSVANVIHRGMIEAEIRMRALSLAKGLQANGNPVLAVYADSVIVAQGEPLPELPSPWRVSSDLTNLSFTSATTFISTEMVKLPGIPREGLSRLTFRETMGTLAKQNRPLVALPKFTRSAEMEHLITLARAEDMTPDRKALDAEVWLLEKGDYLLFHNGKRKTPMMVRVREIAIAGDTHTLWLSSGDVVKLPPRQLVRAIMGRV